MLLNPWRSIDDLKIGFSNWEDAFTDFMTNTNEHNGNVVSKIQFHYACKQAADNPSDINHDDDLDQDIGEEPEH